MWGDSDKALLPEEGEDGEADPMQVTSQELRRLRMEERRRQAAQSSQSPGSMPLRDEADRRVEAESTPRAVLPSLPPWPTPHSPDPPRAGPAKTLPLPGTQQPGTSPPPLLSVAPPTGTSAAALPPVTPAAPQAPVLPMTPVAPVASAPPPQPGAGSASVRRRTAPFTPSQAPEMAAAPSVPFEAGSYSLPGWQGFRRHSHWLIPVLLVIAFFLVVAATNPGRAVPMVFVFAAVGVLQAGILLYAPNDAFWAVGVVGGFLVFLCVAFFALFEVFISLILSILLLSLGGAALRERYYPVKEGTVAVMGLFGRYSRTLQPGFNLRAPGEKALGVIETQRIRHDVNLPPITLFSGEQVTLSVAIMYQVVPGQEYLAIRTTKDWQKPIQQQLVAVIRDVISALSADDFRASPTGHQLRSPLGALAADEVDETPAASPIERINERLTSAMRDQVADRGVTVHAVNARLLERPRLTGGAHPSTHQALAAHPTVALPGGQAPGQRVVDSIPPVAQMTQAGGMAALGASSAPAGWPGQMALPPQSVGVPVALPLAGVGAPAGGTPFEPMTLLSAQALAEAYDAVVCQRITDLATIRRIIAQFEAVASDPTLSQQVPFDAAAGAQNLINHLRHLEARNFSHFAQQSGGGAVAPDNIADPYAADEED